MCQDVLGCVRTCQDASDLTCRRIDFCFVESFVCDVARSLVRSLTLLASLSRACFLCAIFLAAAGGDAIMTSSATLAGMVST